jgi:hypothetical protein
MKCPVGYPLQELCSCMCGPKASDLVVKPQSLTHPGIDLA